MQLWIVFILLMITNAIGTFAYASRLAGVRAGSINNSGTLYNALTLFSRLANMFMLPLIGVLVEKSIKSGDLEGLTWDFRILLLGSALGIALASLLIPTMSDVFLHTIGKLKEHKSLTKVIRKEIRLSKLPGFIRVLRLPNKETINRLSLKAIPKNFILLNVFIYCIYTVGFLAAIYSGALMPEYRLVSSNLSSAINGFATIALYILVDPIINVISDEVMDKENPRPIQDLKSTIAFLSVGRFLGALLAQLVFVPVAYFIVWVAQFFI